MNEFPIIFSGAKSVERLYYARQAVVRQHGGRRTKEGYAIKRSRKAEKENGNEEKENVKAAEYRGEILDLTVSRSLQIHYVVLKSPSPIDRC